MPAASLTDFLRDLLAEGRVTVAGWRVAFDPADEAAAAAVLARLHADDALDLPGTAPDFAAAAALWAARYLYFATQLVLLRDWDETAVADLLTDFPLAGEPDAAAVYSADLCLRHLPDLLRLAKGLAPADPLVQQLEATAARWPFSFVGAAAGAEAPPPPAVLAHPALRLAYADRLVRTADRARAAHPAARPLLREALGLYAKELAPALADLFEQV